MSSPVLTVTARDIAFAALRAAGIIRPDEQPQAEDMDTAIEAMNYLLKEWQADSAHLWKQREGLLFTNVGQEKYLLGPDGAHATTDDDFIYTTLTTAAVATDTELVVEDTTGMAGASDLFVVNPVQSTQGWTAGNSAVLTTSSGLNVENGAASAGYADWTIEVTIGDTYLIDYGYVKGASAGADFSVIDPITAAVLDTNSETASTTGVLEFVATQEDLTFRIANTSTTLGEDSTLESLELRNKGDGDKVGLKLDDNTRQWTNIVRVLSATELEINAQVTGAAAVSQTVFTYTDIINRPLRVYNERSETITSNNEIPIRKWSREEYMRQPSKSSQGSIIQIYYSPKLSNGEMYVWQTASDVNQVARFTFDEPIFINDDSMDNPDIPSEWFNALKWNVAAEILPEYRTNQTRLVQIIPKAAAALDKALSFDEEDDELQISPDFDGISY